MFDSGVSTVLPILFEDIGVFKKKLAKGGIRSRPPSAYTVSNLEGTSPKLDSTDIRTTEPSISETNKRPPSRQKIFDELNKNKNSEEELNLAEMSRAVENSLADLSQISRPQPIRQKLAFKFANKARAIRESSSDKESSADHPKSDNGSASGSAGTSNRGRFKPMHTANSYKGLNQGDDVFLKSIFGVGSKNVSARQSAKGSVQERSSDRGSSNGNPGASGMRMKFVRNILVSVNSFYQKPLPTEKRLELDFTKKSSDTGSSNGSNKKELFKMLQNVENRNILINKKGPSHQRKVSLTNSNTSYNHSASKNSAGRSPVKIMKLVGPESTVRDTEKKHFKLMNSVDDDSSSIQKMDSGLLKKKPESVDMNRTMPNLKEALEKEAFKNEAKLVRTNTSMQSEDDDVG